MIIYIYICSGSALATEAVRSLEVHIKDHNPSFECHEYPLLGHGQHRSLSLLNVLLRAQCTLLPHWRLLTLSYLSDWSEPKASIEATIPVPPSVPDADAAPST
jgi:hypothetical protein